MYNCKLIRRIFFILLTLFSVNTVFGQDKLVAKYKKTDSTIMIRWAVSEIKIFKEAINYGYTIRKLEMDSNQRIHESKWDEAEVFKIFPLGEVDSFWVKNQKTDERTILVYSVLFNHEKKEEIIEVNEFGLSLVACDQSRELAMAAGLFFEDKIIDNNKNYAYQIETNGNKKYKFTFIVDNKLNICPEIQNFKLECSNGTVNISWKHSGLMQQYSSFQIERSIDSMNFYSILKQRFVPMYSQFEKEKELSIWKDSSVQLNQKYFYKIKAFDYFGDCVRETEVKTIEVFPILKTNIVIDSIYEEELNSVVVAWNHSEDTNILEYHIYHSKSFNGEYQLKEKTKKLRAVISIDEYSNYFKIIAVSKYGDSISSWPELFILPDRKAPLPIKELIGAIDSLGNVTLTWKGSEESDFMGYRVFRANTKREEFIEISKKFVLENSFNDSIYLENLTEKIYYFIKAVDSNYNNSTVTDTIELKKPDITAPVAAQIRNIKSDKNGILIEWVASPSLDAINIQLLFSPDDKNYQTLASFLLDNKNTSFLDTTVEFEKGVYYKLKVEDDDGNVSLSKPIYAISQKAINSKKYWCETKVDRKEKVIEIKWESPTDNVFSYTIYKAKQGEILRSYVTLEPTQSSYIDRNLYISNNYIYSIKATLESGREVVIIDDLLVEY